ncbi:hypothetical protein EDC34_107123 [Thermomonas haemolytica]|uniref:Pyridoxamine 5'-phosphate oxidase n=2 Tax=Thermomonas haemolytica TaxID=141949 RepID=A0A4R3N318_9GAMM|nr:hypothetical protein EDC34_107123 [Thermomonas haemolytica]
MPHAMPIRSAPDWLDADRAAFMQAAVSMSLGARDAALRPSVTRGVGCRVLADGEVRVFVNAALAGPLADDVATNGQVAVVFSDIVSHRTLQVKATDARVQALDAEDHAAVDAYVRAFGATVVGYGYPEAIPLAILHAPPEDRIAIVCHPREGFEQTPGPQAGQRLEGAR